MYRFVQPGERVFVILTSGSLSISQSVITLLGDDFDSGRGLAQAGSLYDAARIVGDCVRRISDIDVRRWSGTPSVLTFTCCWEARFAGRS